ncbi:fumarylacetoacetate hydrolase [Peribacillus cavernae]|uniref:Fumarylacetoacetate hydrolase n=1 Tax=Peribacillus cavernae TaxID=1674310 RepID=A0A3S0U2K2_9BACI|nr:fumarylacetoacetate hydrolase family protein [Peribacillus cavernae]MDQ0218063.1 2-dehydro-3-deoxy-D-arabinonate dehydratase [Peribacillus cavernae]RUQ32776.1 fumarylacetoacetate hydrolase [Peribacillus cavernae]
MRIIRYLDEKKSLMAAVTKEENIYNLPFSDFLELVYYSRERKQSILAVVEESVNQAIPLNKRLVDLKLLVPIEAKEVWACGVTYERSKEARNYEATGGKLDAATFYDKVYDAERPEIFFKSTGDRTVGTEQDVYLRSDSNWQIPEPELGLILDKKGVILGYTIGNDMSCRDIEGENPLYLPQAKIWKNSCSIGPAILLAESVEDPYQLEIHCCIYRREEKVFEGSAKVNQLKRKFDELVSFLVRDNIVFDGTVLLTGTCVVPPNEFTLNEGDRIEIDIPGIGTLNNPVKSLVGKSVTLL